MPPKNNLKGRTFNRLKVLKFAGRDKRGNTLWKCRCLCGNIVVVRGGHLESDNVQSCKCLQRELRSRVNFKHGASKTSTYRAWVAMRQRVREDPNYRNVRICKPWLQAFGAFLFDMGICPPGKMLDRKDNFGNYEPGNCRWATRTEQNNNKRNNRLLTFNGRTQTVAQWAAVLGVKAQRLRVRLHRGWSVKRTLSTPLRAC